jgi:hypothetical protein
VASPLAGTVDIPHVGKLPKAAVLGGVALVVVLVIIDDRKASAASSSPAAAAGGAYPPDGTTGDPNDPYSTDPSTGQTYGDEAGTGAGAGYGGFGTGIGGGIQSAADPYPWDGTYGNPNDPFSMDSATGQTYGDEGSAGTGSGGGTGTPSGPPFSTNSQWSQYVLNYFGQSGSTGGMADAIGRYLAGQQVTVAQQGLINDAIAIAGPVPVAGANGYPPSIRVTGGPPPTGPSKNQAPRTAPSPVTTSTSQSQLTVTWPPVGGANKYEVEVSGPQAGVKASPTVSQSRAVFSVATSGDSGTVKVRAGNAAGWGPWSPAKPFKFARSGTGPLKK